MDGEARTQQLPAGLSVELPIAYRALVSQRREAYYRYAYSKLGAAGEAREAVNDCLAKLYFRWQEALRSENLAAFAWKMLHDHVVDELRRRDRRPVPVDTAFLSLSHHLRAQQEDPIEALLERIDLYRALSALPLRQRQCFWLRHVLGYKATEIADITGLAASTVRTHLQLAVAELERALRLGETIPEPRKAS